MAPPFYSKPENALKRAEELIAVNQSNNALTLLYDVIVSKKSRTTPLPSLEPIVLKFVDLCVDLRKGKLAKEALNHYKNIAQNTSVSTIEQVIKQYIDQAELKVTQAQNKAQSIALDQIEDLEAIETPESILMSAVSGEDVKDRTDREVVTPWLKFLWESYRTALDILRNNARLEILYQMVANHAFAFCLKYARKTEFRRLCELLRSHVSTAQRYSHQANMVNLNEPETLQRHLDTRFVQLNAATDLELWNEAFKSIEDVQQLLSMSKKAPRPFMMANYYEKLAKIFLVADNYLFHSAAINKYFSTVRAHKPMTEEEQVKMASTVLISILAIPIITTVSPRLDLDDTARSARLTALLRSARPPTREALLKEALSRNLLAKVTPEIRELYNILEVEFHPLNICQRIAPILSKLSNSEFSKYVEPLHQVVLTRVLQQLSQVYSNVKMDFITNLLSLPPPFAYSAQDIEKFIMNGCKKGELSIRIDHSNQTLEFVVDPFVALQGTISEGPSLSSLPSEQMRLQLVRLAKRFSAIVDVIDPPTVNKDVFSHARLQMEAQRKQVLERIHLIERKKEKRELDAQRKDEQRLAQHNLKKRQEAESERLRMQEEEKKREQDRILNQRREIERAEAKKLAEKLAEDLKNKNSKIKVEELEQLDTQKLLELQQSTMEQEKRDFLGKLKATAKRFDHLERAFRKEEKELLVQDYHEQKQRDLATHEEMQRLAQESVTSEWKEHQALKQTLGAILEDYNALKSDLVKKWEAKKAKALEQAKDELEREKDKKLQEVRLKKAAERMRAEVEVENRRKREEQDRLRREEEERMAEERRIREEEREREYEEQKRKLDEQARKQAERERLAEEKIRAASAAAPSVSVGEGDVKPWRKEENTRWGSDKREENTRWGSGARDSERPREEGRWGSDRREETNQRWGASREERPREEGRWGSDSRPGFNRGDSSFGRHDSRPEWRRGPSPSGERPSSRQEEPTWKRGPSPNTERPGSRQEEGRESPAPGKYRPPVRRDEGSWRK